MSRVDRTYNLRAKPLLLRCISLQAALLLVNKYSAVCCVVTLRLTVTFSSPFNFVCMMVFIQCLIYMYV